MATVAVNAFITNKNWETQTNPNHSINGKIQDHAKGQVIYKQVIRGRD